MKRTLRTFALPALLLLPALAQAHAGHDHEATFAAGALHPFAGTDHLLLLLVAGLLAVRLGKKAAYALGAIFLGLIGAGAAGDDGAWVYAAGFLLSGAGIIFVTRTAAAAALGRTARRFTAASRRSPTSAAASAPAHRPSDAPQS